jgi:CubicO group peptidase (beta-lactamase class C family)
MIDAERSGFSAERLAGVDRRMTEQYVDTGQIPGGQIQIWRKGALAHSSVIGLMDIEHRKPMREDTIFRIYSMTKPITAVAFMMLVEEGRISLDDEVATYIPKWKDLAVFVSGEPGAFETRPPKRPMKVIDLLTHTSGLTYDWMGQNSVDAAYAARSVGALHTEGGLDTLIDQLAGLPLVFSPGDAWNYSLSTDVLGYLVQHISGMRFGAFLRERLFAPLGMDDTDFFCPPEKISRLAPFYRAQPDGPLLRNVDDAGKSFASPPKLEAGGAGLVSTAADYMRFCRMMLNGGSLDGRRYLSPKTVALFSLNLLPQNREISEMSTNPADWGMGGAGQSLACAVTANVAGRGIPGTIGEFFWSGAACTQFWIDPKEDLAVVFMTQIEGSPHHFSLPEVLRTLVYSAFTESLA